MFFISVTSFFISSSWRFLKEADWTLGLHVVKRHSPILGKVMWYSVPHCGQLTAPPLFPFCFSSSQRCRHDWWIHLVQPLHLQGLTHSALWSSLSVAKHTQQCLDGDTHTHTHTHTQSKLQNKYSTTFCVNKREWGGLSQPPPVQTWRSFMRCVLTSQAAPQQAPSYWRDSAVLGVNMKPSDCSEDLKKSIYTLYNTVPVVEYN